MIETSQSQIGASIPSRDGRYGVFAIDFTGPYGIPMRDAVGASVRVRVHGRERPMRMVVVFSDSYTHEHVAQKLGQPALASPAFEMECSLARIGDALDDLGSQLWEDEKEGRVELPCYSYDFERWFGRPPALEEQAIQYLRAKVYWAWRFDQASAVVTASDLIRLRVAWHTLDRMAQLGDGLYWMRDPGSHFFVPESAALRAYHAKVTGKPADSAEVAALLVAPRYRGPRAHWEKAQGFMSPATRDFANAAKEAMCTVEGLARLVVRDESATFGELLKRLRKEFAVDPAMIKSMEGLWGYTSNEPGVRHGAAADQQIGFDQAQYVLGSAEAAIKLLLSLDE